MPRVCHRADGRLSATGQRPLPAWYDDAKLGVFVHWGPYSVPGWAPLSGDIQEIFASKGPRHYFAHNPYAEWYVNSVRIPGSPTWRHHREVYGEAASYADLGARFDEHAAGFDPDSWARLFARAGARYVVLTAKHMDGFALWPSAQTTNRGGSQPGRGWGTTKDLVGGVTAAVREAGMKMGLYYCGGFDASFEGRVIRTLGDCVLAVPRSAEYADYAEAQVRELVERYRPAVLWNDVAFPASVDLDALLSTYYAAVPDGVANDRWAQFSLPRPGTLANRFVSALLHHGDRLWPLLPRRHRRFGFPAAAHGDFRTPEYDTPAAAGERKWELARGLGNSFSFNREEGDSETLSLEALVHLLVDVVSKNGNLLIGVGPRADGTIPDRQSERLEGLGAWLDVHGEAIFETRPWKLAASRTEDGRAIRFTSKDGVVFATLLSVARSGQVALPIELAAGSEVGMLGRTAPLQWEPSAYGATVTIPAEAVTSDVAWSLRITPEPLPVS
ncbi:MAG: alpha-L-fucosidase [bacterium]|nr:alpha-L-fucosidase [bacterium]